MANWWNAHAHSNFSVLDGMSQVVKLVRRAAALEQPALGLTDHGNMAGTTQLYTECRKAGIVPFPGIEAYLIDPQRSADWEDGETPQRYHFGLLALDSDGYRALVKAVTLSHTRPRFSRFPRFTMDDLLDLGDMSGAHLAITTGCFFGYVQQALVHGNQTMATDFIEALGEVYPHIFVELQHHNIEHDEDPTAMVKNDTELVKELHYLAGELDLPVVATADNHYLTHDQKPAHVLMKEMVGSVFPGDSFHLPSEREVAAHYPSDIWADCLDGSDQLLALNQLVIPALDTYRPRVPTMQPDAQQVLTETCTQRLNQMFADGLLPRSKTKVYFDRLNYELPVIEQIDMANYMLLWDLIVKWCRSEHIAIEARGSANGSLVCFLLGVTQVDPVKWDVTFDRFLSVDRIKPADIDMDIEDVSRQRLIGYLKKNFDLRAIGTWGHLGITTDQDGDEKGSVLVTYRTYLANEMGREYEEWRTANKDPNKKMKPHDKERAAEVAENKKLIYANINTMADVEEYFPQHVRALQKISQMGSVQKSYGVHAGGLLLSGDDLKISDWIPTMLVASSETTVTQYDMDDVEQWGLVKLDVLGQKSLTILRLCQQKMGRADPTDFTWIPENDPKAMEILRSGLAGNGVFHAEGWTRAKGFKQMKPKHMNDIVLGTALFMPGAMDHGQTDKYLNRRFHPDLRNRVFYPHDVYKQVLGATYGALIFQDQTLNILRGLDMSIEDINKMFKIVKDSGKGAVARNRERLKPIRETFDQKCREAGVKLDSNGTYDKAWDWITGVVAYAFGKAHATGYGIRCYRFAYLKANHPLEFHAALLEANVGVKDKEPMYIKEVRRMGIPMLHAHVNFSSESWEVDSKRQAIRKGLVSLQGIGWAAASEIVAQAPFSSVRDLATRCTHRAVSGRIDYLKDGTWRGTLLALKEAGALKDLPE